MTTCWGRCGAGHHDQPLFVFLAGLSGSCRRKRAASSVELWTLLLLALLVFALYFIVIASPLRSAFAISPTCRPESSRMAPFWLVSTIARTPPPTARPAPAAA